MHIEKNTFSLIEIPKIIDEKGRGNLSVIEKDGVPFDIKRVYYLYDVPSDAYRGGHAHKEQLELLIALSGSFEVVLDNGFEKKKVMLNKPNIGLLIPTGVWRELENFSSGSVCLVLASDVFNENDYIRNYSDFKLFVGA
ncbi:sugar 3,4-ketoisomerase [Aestuariibaculum lutulentum]|uniref:FdtA/QdtA family cupin domain-containing protein n=1 Tax=Aestuariibaculum lutulentum TaxID=2920935 RepID=A0ABS9REL3_9FLAO|nr:FdtA/QdtA family cupin domain-containing protein [Aestuariibaculum lutulentum]MCH4551347.1 FdtA/QdtA family cupin domain-containing protein [Aestuariibaculum lutulentum]